MAIQDDKRASARAYLDHMRGNPDFQNASEQEKQRIRIQIENAQGLTYSPADDAKWEELREAISGLEGGKETFDEIERMVRNDYPDFEEGRIRIEILDRLSRVDLQDPQYDEAGNPINRYTDLFYEHNILDYSDTDLNNNHPGIEAFRNKIKDINVSSLEDLKEIIDIAREVDLHDNLDTSHLLKELAEIVKTNNIQNKTKTLGDISKISDQISDINNTLKNNRVVIIPKITLAKAGWLKNITGTVRNSFVAARESARRFMEERELDRKEQRNVERVRDAIKAVDDAYIGSKKAIDAKILAKEWELEEHRRNAKQHLHEMEKMYNRASFRRKLGYGFQKIVTGITSTLKTGKYSPITEKEYNEKRKLNLLTVTDRRSVDALLMRANEELKQIEKIREEIGRDIEEQYHHTIDNVQIDKPEGLSYLEYEIASRRIRTAMFEQASPELKQYIQQPALDKNGREQIENILDKNGRILANTKFAYDTDQLRQLKIALEEGKDVGQYADPEISAKKMAIMRAMQDINIETDLTKEQIIGMGEQELENFGQRLIEELVTSKDFLWQFDGTDIETINQDYNRMVNSIKRDMMPGPFVGELSKVDEHLKENIEKYGFGKDDTLTQYIEANKSLEEQLNKTRNRSIYEIEERDATIEEKDAKIQALEDKIKEKNKTIREHKIIIKNKDQEIENMAGGTGQDLSEKDARIQELESLLKEKDKTIESLQKSEPDHTSEGISQEKYDDLLVRLEVTQSNNEAFRKQIQELTEKVNTLEREKAFGGIPTNKEIEDTRGKIDNLLVQREAAMEKAVKIPQESKDNCRQKFEEISSNTHEEIKSNLESLDMKAKLGELTKDGVIIRENSPELTELKTEAVLKAERNLERIASMDSKMWQVKEDKLQDSVSHMENAYEELVDKSRNDLRNTNETRDSLKERVVEYEAGKEMANGRILNKDEKAQSQDMGRVRTERSESVEKSTSKEKSGDKETTTTTTRRTTKEKEFEI